MLRGGIRMTWHPAGQEDLDSKQEKERKRNINLHTVTVSELRITGTYLQTCVAKDNVEQRLKKP